MPSTSPELKQKIVVAGAGAGKTTALIRQVQEFVQAFRQKHQRFPSLVLTTFTIKATQELRGRLIVEASKDQDFELLQYYSNESQMFISTIDGVLSRFLRQYGYLANIDPSFEIQDEEQAKLMSKKALRKCIHDGIGLPLLEDYSFDDLVEICRRYRYLQIEHSDCRAADGEDFEACLRFELANISVELHNIANNIVPPETKTKWIEYVQHLKDCSREFSNSKTNDLNSIVEKYKNFRRPSKSKDFELDEGTSRELASVNKKINDVGSNPIWNRENWSEYFHKFSLFKTLGIAFQVEFDFHKSSLGRYEISDLSYLVLKIVRQHPNLAKAFSFDWDYWFIDEFQDTSPLQVELLNHFIGEKACYRVGDPQQSIYLFRGAQREVFNNAVEQVKNSGVVEKSIKNYRSQPSLLAFFNDFFSGFDKQFQAMEPRSNEFQSETPVAWFGQFLECPESDHKRENEFKSIFRHIQSGIESGANLDEFCILARAHADLADIANYLKMNSIAVSHHRSGGFYDSQEIRDALFLLKFLINPHDNKNLVSLFRSPFIEFSADKLIESIQMDQDRSHWMKIIDLNKENATIEYLKNLHSKLKVRSYIDIFVESLHQLNFFKTSELFDKSGYREANLWKLIAMLREQSGQPGFSLLNFCDLSRHLKLNSGKGSEANATSPKEPNRVNLMTIHASKGLKFKNVIIPFCDKKPRVTFHLGLTGEWFSFDKKKSFWSLPVSLGDDSKKQSSVADKAYLRDLNVREREEFNRLLYVAMTRAETSVFLSTTGQPAPGSWAASWHWNQNLERANYLVEYIDQAKNLKTPIKSQAPRLIQIREKIKPPTSSRAQYKKFSVSSVLTEMTYQADSKEKTITYEDFLRPEIGTRLHRYLEIASRQSLECARDIIGQDLMDDDRKKYEKALLWVRSQVEPPMSSLLDQGEAEYGFQLKTTKGIMEGQIDLWGLVEVQQQQQIWILDYKSGSMSHVDRAFDQLDIYSLAIAKIHPNIPIQLATVFPFHEKSIVRKASNLNEILKKFPKIGQV